MDRIVVRKDAFSWIRAIRPDNGKHSGCTPNSVASIRSRRVAFVTLGREVRVPDCDILEPWPARPDEQPLALVRLLFRVSAVLAQRPVGCHSVPEARASVTEAHLNRELFVYDIACRASLQTFAECAKNRYRGGYTAQWI